MITFGEAIIVALTLLVVFEFGYFLGRMNRKK